MALKLGTAPVTNIYLGSTPVKEVRLGSTLVWSRAAGGVFEDCGFLNPGQWINETIGGGVEYISDGVNGIVDTAFDYYADIVAFLPNALGALAGVDVPGSLLGVNAPDPDEGICGVLSSVGGLTDGDVQDGILGFINGIPIIGGFLPSVGGLPTTLDDINTLVGTIPIVGQLGRLLGLIPNEDGTFEDPVNMIVDAVGNVLGFITCGSITAETVETALGFVIGGICNQSRLLIPDGLLSLDLTTARTRLSDVFSGDDGWIRTQVGSLGSYGMATDVFRRFSNDGSGGSGVGYRLQDSVLSIIRRVGSTTTIMEDAGSYAAGDMIWMEQVGDVHTLFRNGIEVAEWDDVGNTASQGAGFRSAAMIMSGAKELLGPRQFSPGLISLEAA
jgi:hypothetical protein